MRSRKVFLNTILGVVIAAGCAEPPTGPDQAARITRILPPLTAFTTPVQLGPMLFAVKGAPQLVPCKPLKRDKKDKDIDAKGGQLDIGPHSLVIPAGALTKKTRITAEILGDGYNTIRFSPEGLQFAKTAFLFMSYENCEVSFPQQVQLLYTTDDLTAILEELPSFDDEQDQTVVGQLTHFSQYAVAY